MYKEAATKFFGLKSKHMSRDVILTIQEAEYILSLDYTSLSANALNDKIESLVSYCKELSTQYAQLNSSDVNLGRLDELITKMDCLCHGAESDFSVGHNKVVDTESDPHSDVDNGSQIQNLGGNGVIGTPAAPTSSQSAHSPPNAESTSNPLANNHGTALPSRSSDKGDARQVNHGIDSVGSSNVQKQGSKIRLASRYGVN